MTEPAAGPPSGIPAAADTSVSPPLHVTTDVLDIAINLKGGELDQADLLRYPLRKDAPNVPVRLLSREPPASLYLLQTGLSGTAGEAAPTHLAIWVSAEKSFALAPGAKELRVPLTWSDGQGLTVTKTFVFTRGLYAIDLIYDVQNAGTAPRQSGCPTRKSCGTGNIRRDPTSMSRPIRSRDRRCMTAPNPRTLNVENDTDSKFSETITNGWLASLQHQFVAADRSAARISPTNTSCKFRDNEYLLSATGPTAEVAAGAKAQFHEKLFVGPKLQSQLAATGPNLERTVDFGILTVLAQPLFMALNWMHGLVGNWGWAIIIVTALIKLIFYPLSQASGRSMAKMRTVASAHEADPGNLQGRSRKIGSRHDGAVQEGKDQSARPAACRCWCRFPSSSRSTGCCSRAWKCARRRFCCGSTICPRAIPFFVLPLLMGAAMFAQFKLNPPPPDPMQAKIMQFMPLIMTGMMAWFPCGLVLYWLTNTLLTILQQWRVNQVVEAEAAKPRS